MSKLTNDLMYIGEVAHHGPEDLFIAIMTILGAFGVMLFINWQLALLTFIIMPIVIWLALYFNKKMTKAFTTLNKDIGDFSARVENNIGGIRLVQAFGNESFEKNASPSTISVSVSQSFPHIKSWRKMAQSAIC